MQHPVGGPGVQGCASHPQLGVGRVAPCFPSGVGGSGVGRGSTLLPWPIPPAPDRE